MKTRTDTVSVTSYVRSLFWQMSDLKSACCNLPLPITPFFDMGMDVFTSRFCCGGSDVS